MCSINSRQIGRWELKVIVELLGLIIEVKRLLTKSVNNAQREVTENGLRNED